MSESKTTEPATKRMRLKQDRAPRIDDVNIRKLGPLLPPGCLIEEVPVSDTLAENIHDRRCDVADIVMGKDDRLVCIVGPCSIHDVKAAKEYALKLRRVSQELEADLLIVMRVYFEKPRTTVGWKGLINDPDLDGSFQINKGLRAARTLLKDINELGLGAAVEFLDTISPQYIADLVSWGAIGARTTESQVHRELASGLSMPIGFKNGTGGTVKIAADAIMSSTQGHSFLSVTKQGVSAIVHTNGNPHCHLILRGGSGGPNYDAENIAKATAVLVKGKIDPSIMIDCSHANSSKLHTNQPVVAAAVAEQVAAGNTAIRGVMIESHLVEGNQKLDPGKTFPGTLTYGQSVTDACLSFEDTIPVLQGLAEAVRARRAGTQESA